MRFFREMCLKRPVIRLFKASLFFTLILVSPVYAHAAVWSASPDNTIDNGAASSVPYDGSAFGFRETGNLVYIQLKLGIANSTVTSGTFVVKDSGGSTQDCHSATYSNVATDLGVPDGNPAFALYPVITIAMSGTACNITGVAAPSTGETVTFVASANAGNLYFGYMTGVNEYWYKAWDTVPSAPDTTTHIDLVSPYDGAPVPSTSPVTLEASGYINPSDGILTNVDETTGIRVQWSVTSKAAMLTNCTDVICAFNQNNTGRLYLTGTGYAVFGSQTFNVSTSTGVALPPDIYTMTTSVTKPSSFFGLTNIFGIKFGTDILVSTTTKFTVGSTTLTQELINSNAASWLIGATTTQAFATSCNIISTSFSVNDCLIYLLLPNQNDLQSLIGFAQTNILARAPWGYATRLVTILTDNASSTASADLPTFTINFPASSPLYSDPMTFNMQEMLDTGSSTLNGVTDPISGKTVKQIMEPYIELFIAISALIIMFHDIMGMGKYNKGYADK